MQARKLKINIAFIMAGENVTDFVIFHWNNSPRMLPCHFIPNIELLIQQWLLSHYEFL